VTEARNTIRNEVVVIAPLGEPDRRVRLAKTIGLMSGAWGQDVRYWGWRRTEDEKLGAALPGVVETRALLSGGGYRSSRARLYYIGWIIKVFFALLWHAPRRVHCLGLETALPAWAASRIRRRIRYVFDDADRLVLLWPLPRLVERLLVFLERRTSRAAVAHIVPTFERYDYRTDKMVEIANLPDERQVDEARQRAGAKPDSRLHVYVNGWIDVTRGLGLLDAAAEMLDKARNESVVFNVAVSRLTSEASRFMARSNVNDLGTLTHIDSLAQYPANDVVVTFYDPAIRINRYALPNKWGDAIAMGTPIVLNGEIVTARPLIEAGAALPVAFDRPDELAALLTELAADRLKLAAAKLAIEQAAEKYEFFNEAIEPVLTSLLRSGATDER
jgi:hypothetical protein